ncbi:unnamed protein product [Ceutorhynchus assimilis]|uniref:Uncharacterized protein n=1 Tax=Ceutorhynchus assimilis TaxID=467358 RepID=A0A9N9MX44_9CUCU|nr:unnamed protein product [Ceutorhynchus assimilis]
MSGPSQRLRKILQRNRAALGLDLSNISENNETDSSNESGSPEDSEGFRSYNLTENNPSETEDELNGVLRNASWSQHNREPKLKKPSLSQCITWSGNKHVKNYSGKILEYIIIDNIETYSVEQSNQPLVKYDPHHPALELFFDTGVTEIVRDNYSKIMAFNFHKADYNAFNSHFSNMDWSFIDEPLNLDEIVENFYRIVYSALDRFVPKRAVADNKFPKWYSAPLKKLNSF